MPRQYASLDASERLVAAQAPAVPSARVHRTANQTILNATSTIVEWQAARQNFGTLWSAAAPTRLTFSDAGVWIVGTQIRWGQNTTGRRIMRLKVNGLTYIALSEFNPANGGEVTAPLVTEWLFAANDYAEVEVLHTAGASLDVVYATEYSPEFFAHYVRPA